MGKYRVHATVVGSKYIGDFEAESKEAAEDAASEEACVSLCHECVRECENAEIAQLTAELITEDGSDA